MSLTGRKSVLSESLNKKEGIEKAHAVEKKNVEFCITLKKEMQKLGETRKLYRIAGRQSFRN